MVLIVYRVHSVRKDGNIGTEDTVDRKKCVYSNKEIVNDQRWKYISRAGHF